MGKNLFNHLNELTHGNNENYFDELTETERRHGVVILYIDFLV